MAQITEENGISDCTCNGDHWFIVYNGTEYLFHGLHEGQVTTPHTIEYFDTEQEMIDRVDVLGVTIPVEEIT